MLRVALKLNDAFIPIFRNPARTYLLCGFNQCISCIMAKVYADLLDIVFKEAE